MNKRTIKWLLYFSKTILENEQRREQNIISQAVRMQTAFSFVIMAFITIVQLLLENWENAPKKIIIIAVSTIIISLALSLVFATVVQWRKKRSDLPSANNIISDVIKHEEYYKSNEQQNYYLLETYNQIHKSLEDNNNWRNKYLKLSMYFFFVSLSLSAVWFIVFLCL